jgi:replicative DNA helicase
MVSLEDIKLPPHNIDAEKRALGGVLMDNEMMYYYDGLGLVPEDFYNKEHFYIYQGMKKLW